MINVMKSLPVACNLPKNSVMKVSTVMLEDELYESFNEANQGVRIDMRPAGTKAGQNPTEMLLSALAACAAVDIVLMLKKRRKQVVKFEIQTDGTRQDTPPRYFTKIHSHYKITSPDVETEELNKIAELSLIKYCSVGGSLKSELTYSVEVVRP